MPIQQVVAHIANFPTEQAVKTVNPIDVTIGNPAINVLGTFWQASQPVSFSDSSQVDAAGRLRVSQMDTLFDGRCLHEEDSRLWTSAGTGTLSWANAVTTMSVTAGQYHVRQSRWRAPYFSGKPQQAEITFDTFAPEAGVVKRVGYYSSTAVAPYGTDFDGWWLESDGDTGRVELVVSNFGTEKLRTEITVPGYDWDNFSVILGDFLWLGGAVHRLYLKSPQGGFSELNVFDYAGTEQGTFMRSPNQPVRYEIRSTTGSGTLRAVCSQVSTEGSVANLGQSKVLYHSTLISASAVGTIYAVKGVKKLAAYRDAVVKLAKFTGSMTTVNDVGVWMMLRNPTLSASLTYASNGYVNEATATTQTVSSVGRVIEAVHCTSAGVSQVISDNALAYMGMAVADTPDEYVLAFMPLTSNQSVNGAIHIMEL